MIWDNKDESDWELMVLDTPRSLIEDWLVELHGEHISELGWDEDTFSLPALFFLDGNLCCSFQLNDPPAWFVLRVVRRWYERKLEKMMPIPTIILYAENNDQTIRERGHENDGNEDVFAARPRYSEDVRGETNSWEGGMD